MSNLNSLDNSFIEKSIELDEISKAKLRTPTNSDAAVVIQRSWRKYIVKKYWITLNNLIEDYWLINFKDTQVFKYYKDLIEFHSRGDPLLFMKSINPNEAKLIDAAAGVRLKFRLAGVSRKKQKVQRTFYWKVFLYFHFKEKFPPTIHYKIFTHLPIQVW